MTKDYVYLISVLILIFILSSIINGSNFTCYLYDIEYKNICLNLL